MYGEHNVKFIKVAANRNLIKLATAYDTNCSSQEYAEVNDETLEFILNIAKLLDIDGVRFSGVKKGNTTTITVNKADIPKYEAAVNKVKAMYAERNGQSRADEPSPSKPANTPKPNTNSQTVNPNVIGNTPYNELGEKSQLEYITNLKTRHALNIAKQLDEDGVKFSGLKKGTVTTITINKGDKAKYEAAVEKVKASYLMNHALLYFRFGIYG